MTPTEIAKAALCEAGRPDLADAVYENRAGWPASPDAVRSPDREVLLRAFYLAHQPFHPVEIVTSDGHRWLDFSPFDYIPKERT